jgi:serine protease AprX
MRRATSTPPARTGPAPLSALPVLRPVLALVLAALLAAAGTAVPGSPAAAGGARGALDPGLPLRGDALQRVVVSGVPGAADAVRDAVVRVGGVVERALPIVDGVAAEVPARRLAALSGLPGVLAVTADRTAPMTTAEWDETTSASTFVTTAGAAQAWQAGARGQGVGVAVLDTGVSAHPDLAGRLVHGPDLSGEGRHDVDSYGHGTVMAGAVAGNGADSAPARQTGIAPRAHVVSVKVAGANGATDVSTVLAAMHWVAAFADTYAIRVLNLSWGVPSTQDPAVDPLSYGVQRLWARGIVVVVAAGNSGPGAGTVTKPADDPVVLTVGAYDDKGDTNPGNDQLPKWSSQGPTAQGVAKPDVVAPGRTLVLPRAAGSTVEAANPKALVAPSYIKGSGTSQAAAVVSGAAALLLSARPGLTPDQVKAALRGTASPIPNVSASAQGRGRLQVGAALTADVATVPAQPLTATGTGTLEGSRGTMERVYAVCGDAPKRLDDETTAWCEAWDGVSWRADDWSGVSWRSEGWSGVSWRTDAWSGVSWRGVSWRGVSWRSDDWSGVSWRGVSWRAEDWTGVSWREQAWTGAAYGEDDELFLTGFWGERPKYGVRLTGEVAERPAEAGHNRP